MSQAAFAGSDHYHVRTPPHPGPLFLFPAKAISLSRSSVRVTVRFSSPHP